MNASCSVLWRNLAQRRLPNILCQLSKSGAAPFSSIPKHIKEDPIPAHTESGHVIRDLQGSPSKRAHMAHPFEQTQPQQRYTALKAVAFSVAPEFDVSRARDIVSRTKGLVLMPDVWSQVLHVVLDSWGSVEWSSSEVFVFKDGCVVAWAQPQTAHCVAKEFAKFMVDRLAISDAHDYESCAEEMVAAKAEKTGTRVSRDLLVIGESPVAPALSMLAFSHALGRSAKVSVLESKLDAYVSSVGHIPKLLASGKSVSMGRSEILRKTGSLLCLRAGLYVSGTVESLLDTPEYYWSRPVLGEFFSKTCNWLDIQPRISVINRKLDYANECVEILRNDSSERHSLKLEWFIIILIAVEVGFEFLHYFERHRETSEPARFE